MEAEEEMFVVFLEGEEEKQESYIDEVTGEFIPFSDITKEQGNNDVEIIDDPPEVINLLEAVEKFGKPMNNITNIKIEPEDEYVYEFLEDGSQDSDFNPDNLDLSSEDEGKSKSYAKKKETRRYKMLPATQQHSYVEELRKQNPEYAEDDIKLISHLAEVMKDSKYPKPPEGYAVHVDNKYRCTICCKITETLPASERHYAEKHGPRYLKCLACGVDFRCPTNLYKHEKRCISCDQDIILRARAICVGLKGSNRPYIDVVKQATVRERARSRKLFSCECCSSSFTNKESLVAHDMLHRNERPYMCSECPAAYTSKSRLSRHQQKHLNQRFECDHCGRFFSIKGCLVAHIETHYISRHVCTYEGCGKRYASRFALKVHIDGFHRNLPPPCACNICPKRFFKMSLLKTHMKSAHGLILMTKNMLQKQLPKMRPGDLENLLNNKAYMFKSKNIDNTQNNTIYKDIQEHSSSTGGRRLNKFSGRKSITNDDTSRDPEPIQLDITVNVDEVSDYNKVIRNGQTDQYDRYILGPKDDFNEFFDISGEDSQQTAEFTDEDFDLSTSHLHEAQAKSFEFVDDVSLADLLKANKKFKVVCLK